jgi:small subunit ribosomal protein S19
MSRSLWKPLYNNKKNILLEKNFIYKIYDRSQKINFEFINKTVKIYNGIRFFEILITEKMIGHTFGEFAPTRKLPLHKKKK